MASTRLETAKKFISHFENFDTDILESVLADDYVQEYAPASLPPPPKAPDEPSKKWLINFEHGLRNIMTGFPMTAKEYIDAGDVSNRVMVWATSQAHFRDDIKGEGFVAEEWEYSGEYMFLLSMDKSGRKITRIVEFVDSKAISDRLFPLHMKAAANLAKKQG